MILNFEGSGFFFPDSFLCVLAGRQLVLETLYALTSNTKIITEAMNKGQRVISFTNTLI